MDDPFDSILPLKGLSVAGQHGISKIEAQQRATKSMAQRGPDRPDAKLHQSSEAPPEGAKPRTKRPRLVTNPELEGMVSTLLRKHYKESKDGTRSQDRKHASVSFGVLVDKYAVIRGKPSPATGFAEAEAARPGMLALAKLIAEVEE